MIIKCSETIIWRQSFESEGEKMSRTGPSNFNATEGIQRKISRLSQVQKEEMSFKKGKENLPLTLNIFNLVWIPLCFWFVHFFVS